MMTSSNGNIFRVTGHLCWEFTGLRWIPAQRPVTRSFDVFFDLRLTKRLSKQSWCWWFEMLPRPLWRHSNATKFLPHRCADAGWTFYSISSYHILRFAWISWMTCFSHGSIGSYREARSVIFCYISTKQYGGPPEHNCLVNCNIL